MIETTTVKTYWAKIYIAGPINEIESICREYTLTGMCVTVTPTNYIFTGGEQTGAEIGLINYPRFPSTPDDIYNKAVELGNQIMEGCHQLTFTVMTPDDTVYFSRKEELGVKS